MFNEEIFGPVIALIRTKDEEEAIELANDSKFGLAAALTFLQKIPHEARISPLENFRLWVPCAINTFVKSDPRLPFGASKILGTGES